VSPGNGSAAAASAPKVFISYRREGAAAHAGRLYDAMVAQFGEGNVFMDVDMAPGVDFVDQITEVVSACQVLIVVMGPGWATVTDEDGDVRIADPEDFVRLEVETALRRPEVTPIPVLVSGARMPRREDLPAELAPITRRNALELSDARWRYDVGRLNEALDELLTDLTGGRGTVAPTPDPDPTPTPDPSPSPPGPSNGRLVLEGMLVAGLTALAARGLGELIDLPQRPFEPAHVGTAIATVVVIRALTWALVGAALAIWLGFRTRRTDYVRLALIGLLFGGLGGAIGGAAFAYPVFHLKPNPDFLEGLSKAQARASVEDHEHWIEVAAFALTGGVLGGLIGELWRPRRVLAGLAAGLAAGALYRLLLVPLGKPSPVLTFGLAAAAIAGLALLVLTRLGPGRPPVRVDRA
jgi:hypothetical protein